MYSLYDNGDLNECAYQNQDDVTLADNVADGGVDYLPDLGYVNTPLFNLKSIGNSMYIPVADVKACSGNITIGGITYSLGSGLQDSKGNRYFFGLETYNFTSSCFNPTGTYINHGSVLTNILTYNGGLISFSYDTVIIGYDMLPVQYRTYAADYQCARCNSEIAGETVSCNSSYSAKEAYLTKIESSNGDIVRFYYSSRSDLASGKKLDSVVFKRKSGSTEERLRKFVFVHDYFGSGSNPEDFRLKLSELQLYDNNSNHINSYFFEYDSISMPNRVTSKAVDWWGYYNGETSNTSLIADQASKNGNITYARASMLNKITYPTGGATTIEYEMNPWGGLRTKKLRDYDGLTSTVKERSFNYHAAAGDGSNNGQVFDDYLVSNYFATNFTTGALNSPDEGELYLLSCYTHRVNSTPVVSNIMQLIENVNYYGFVTEYFGSDSTGGKIDYTYGSTVYSTGDAYTPPNIDLLTKKTYRRNGSGFELISETQNMYDQLYSDTSNMFSDPVAPFENRIWVKDVTKLRDEMTYGMQNSYGAKHWCKQFLDNSYCISSVPVKLTRTVEKEYDPSAGNALVDTTYYYYDDNSNLQPTRIQKRNSKGEALVIRNIYPTDTLPSGITLTTSEKNALAALVNQNLQSNAYYTEMKKDTLVLSKLLKTYQETQGLPVLKKEKEFPTGSGDLYEYQYTSYDSRLNITDFIAKDKAYHAMIYDSSSNLLANCIGTSNNRIAYTSFETGISGNWSGINYSNIVNGAGVTGNKYYNASGFSLSKTGLASTEAFTVSYWSKDSSYSITGTQSGYPKTLASLIIGSNVWRLYEHLVTGQTTITVSGSGGMDELRLYPSITQMTTYCYLPLIGVNTQCDVNNHITYYEYDAIGRLQLIRDQDKNILKKYEYKYSSQ